MDFIKFSSTLFGVFLVSVIILTVNCQLTPNDYNYIKKTVLNSQKENGLFLNSFESTYQSVFVLKVLKEKIPEVHKICKEVEFQTLKEITSSLVRLNDLLNCKIEIDIDVNPEEFNNSANLDIFSLHEKILIWKNKDNIDWNGLYSKVNTYLTGAGFFSELSNSKKGSLDATAKGLEILQILYVKNSEADVKEDIQKKIITVIQVLQGQFQQLSDNVGIFSSDNLNDFKTNSQIVETFSNLKAIVDFQNLDELNFKILNYILTFKQGYNTIENTFYLVKALNALSYLPVIHLNKKVFDFVEEKSTGLRIVNGFNQELSDYHVAIKYKVDKLGQNSQAEVKDEYDLSDEEESKSDTGANTLRIENASKFHISLENLIKSTGKYVINLDVEFSKNNQNNFLLRYSLPITAVSKVKLNHLKIAVTNSQENLDDKEVTIEYPKRSFKNIKATQKSVIKLKIKMNYGDNQFFKIEQIFLRLRHVEYAKTYSAYATKYQAGDDYYNIDFDLSDTNNIEPYDGIYELTLIVSDSSLDNPMIWNFGKIEVKFKKPSDPSNMTPTFKNIQKEKMETSVKPEEVHNKNKLISIIFSSIIILFLCVYLIFLKKIKLNLGNFPKPSNTFPFIFSIGLVLIILLISFVLLLFYLQLRIVHALFAVLAIILPGSLIIFKALSHISIEV